MSHRTSTWSDDEKPSIYARQTAAIHRSPSARRSISFLWDDENCISKHLTRDIYNSRVHTLYIASGSVYMCCGCCVIVTMVARFPIWHQIFCSVIITLGWWAQNWNAQRVYIRSKYYIVWLGYGSIVRVLRGRTLILDDTREDDYQHRRIEPRKRDGGNAYLFGVIRLRYNFELLAEFRACNLKLFTTFNYSI